MFAWSFGPLVSSTRNEKAASRRHVCKGFQVQLLLIEMLVRAPDAVETAQKCCRSWSAQCQQSKSPRLEKPHVPHTPS